MRLRATYRSHTAGLNIGTASPNAADSCVGIRGIGSANDGADIFQLCSCAMFVLVGNTNRRPDRRARR
jgi:hypothetical protein